IPFDTNYFDVNISLNPRTGYQIKIGCVTGPLNAANNFCQAQSSFETGKMEEPFKADWIGNADKAIQNTLFKITFSINKPIETARLYMSGLGVYETYLDNKKKGDEYLAPGITAYDQWIQVQTYDVTEQLKSLGLHDWIISTGNGWYKGTIGFDGGQKNIYGNQQQAIAELHLTYSDGTSEIIPTDDSWLTTSGKITHSGIYYGEDLDATLAIDNWKPVTLLSTDKHLLKD